MNAKKLFSAIAAVFILFSLTGIFATAEVPAQTMEAETFTSSSGYSLNYRIYRSPACSTGADPAMLIIYFHGDGGKGSDNAAQLAEKGVLEALVSKSAEETYKDFPYIVVAPQCPEGESFAASEDGTSASHTDVMNAVMELFNKLSAEETTLPKCVVMGVGSGTAAALEYALNMTEKTSRLVAVGGSLEPLKASQVYDVGVDFLIFAEEGNESMKSLSEKIAVKSDESPVHFGGSTLDECLDFALGYTNPGIADWVIKDTYISRQFKVSVSCGTGGSIKAVPDVVTYGSSSVVTVTVGNGYAIDKVLVDGEEAEEGFFAKSTDNGRVYTCTLNDIKSNRSVRVELKQTESAGGSGISKAPIIFGAVCVLLLAAAVVIYKLSSAKR